MVPGLNGAGKDLTFQWDNVEFSPVQEGESPSLAFPILFNEGGFCLPISPFSGGSFSLVNNPDTAGHPPGTELDALGIQSMTTARSVRRLNLIMVLPSAALLLI